jgi:hypothetical protein
MVFGSLFATKIFSTIFDDVATFLIQGLMICVSMFEGL